MIELHFIHPNGAEISVQAKPGQSLMQAAMAASVDGIAADCGGLLTCATCHVMVDAVGCADPSALPAASTEEEAMLDFVASTRQPDSRLSCQIPLTPALSGLRVRLPERQY